MALVILAYCLLGLVVGLHVTAIIMCVRLLYLIYSKKEHSNNVVSQAPEDE